MDSPVVRRYRRQQSPHEDEATTRYETHESRIGIRIQLLLTALVVVICLLIAAFLVFGSFRFWIGPMWRLNPPSPSPAEVEPKLTRVFLVWLHSLNSKDYPMIDFFLPTNFEGYNITWSNPVATPKPVTASYGGVMSSWFDISEIPVTIDSAKDDAGVRKAVRDVHSLIDEELATGTNPNHIFICGLGQGGALALASVLLYPRTLGGGAVIHGWFPLSTSILNEVAPDAKKTPILWSHGVNSQVVPLATAQTGSLILKEAGVKCEFKVLSDVGQFLNEKDYDLMESWVESCLQKSS